MCDVLFNTSLSKLFSSRVAGELRTYEAHVTPLLCIAAPVVDMKFFEAVDRTMFRQTIEYITDNVTLNAEEPKIFGCQVCLPGVQR